MTHLRRIIASRDRVMIATTLICALVLSLTIDRFPTYGNAFAILRSISVIGTLAFGMIVVVVGRNIDLSQVVVALISTGVAVKVRTAGFPVVVSLALGMLMALVMGTINAWFVVFGRVPSLFATLASSLLFIGVARITILPGASIDLPAGNEDLTWLGGTIGKVPLPPVVLACAAVATHAFLEFTVAGRFIRAVGINSETAAVVGLPVRQLVWLQYLASAGAAFLGGLLMLSSSGLVDLQAATSTMIFDVVLVVVLGGVSLSGGRGSVLGVLAAVIFVGMILNAMTILDIRSEAQSIIKGIALLLVIIADGSLHRGEAVAKGV